MANFMPASIASVRTLRSVRDQGLHGLFHGTGRKAGAVAGHAEAHQFRSDAHSVPDAFAQALQWWRACRQECAAARPASPPSQPQTQARGGVLEFFPMRGIVVGGVDGILQIRPRRV